jgi:superfamily II DNA or RNA helicase
MLRNVSWNSSRSYRSGTDSEPIEFYLQGLSNSVRFDLLLGYFSSSAINVLSLGFAKFLHSGGTMRVVANNVLSAEDKKAIEEGQGGRLPDDLLDISDIRSLKSSLDDTGRHFMECFAWLIAQKRIEFVIVRPKGRMGIVHYKSGVFSVGQEQIGFKASCNFTAYGMLENLEELEAFASWDNGRSTGFLQNQNDYFVSLLTGRNEHVEFVPVQDVEVAIRTEFGNKDLNELLWQEKELLAGRERISGTGRLRRLIHTLEDELDALARKPRFPYPSGPRAYQQEAYRNWVGNDRKGIFAMATGTGKTITSLNCLLEETQAHPEGLYRALILVPTITLVEQWDAEARGFNFKDIIRVSSKEKWEKDLATMLSDAKRIPTSFIIISTYASFVKERFLKYIRQLPEDTLFIADEAHNIGSKSVLDKLGQIPATKRIGLSATPKRIYDPEGSSAMESYFQDQEPYVYAFPMERAIEEGILCKYYYYPHIVRLEAEELTEYVEISKKLARLGAMNNGRNDNSEAIERLLLKRKQIIHKAKNKLATARAILEERLKKDGDLRYTFIYVPEGIRTEEVVDDDTGAVSVEEVNIIDQYTRMVSGLDPKLMVNKFTSGMPDRDAVLDQFRQGHIHVIASMKCLDEGVDIPRAEHAIFCSSTGNPRQFIQRRGRILRRHPDKYNAVIHDLVVMPDLTISHPGDETFGFEKKMVRTELERVMYFASLSMNPYHTEAVFQEICEHYGLNIYTIYEELKNP